jgi:hypothetical protein
MHVGMVRKKLFSLGICLVLVFSAVGPTFVGISETGWAPAAVAESNEPVDAPSDTTKKFGEIASFILSIFVPIVAIEASIIGAMVDNDFIIGTGEGVESVDQEVLDNPNEEGNTVSISVLLNRMWIVVRDICNYLFILVLVAIAFMIVISAGSVGGGDSALQAGKILPKFVIAVIAVNLTWTGAKIILDAAQIATYVVYSIPQSIPGHQAIFEGACDPNEPLILDDREAMSKVCLVPKEMAFMEGMGGVLTDVADDPNEQNNMGFVETDDESKGQIRYVTGLFTVYFDRMTGFDQFTSNNFASVYGFSILNIQHLPMTQGGEDTFTKLTIRAIAGLLMMIVIIAAFSVMFFVLLERVIIIWVNIILSPLGVLWWVAKDLMPNVGGLGDDSPLGLKKFVQFAFLPALMGVPLSMGAVLAIVGNSTIAGLEFDGVNITGIQYLGFDTLGQVFWYAIAIGIMWKSADIAQKSTVMMGAVVGGIMGAVSNTGKTVAKLPMYAPWIPVYNPTTQTKSGVSAGAIGSMVKYGSNQYFNNKARKQLENAGLGGYGGGGISSEAQNAIKKIDSDKLQGMINELNNNFRHSKTITPELLNKVGIDSQYHDALRNERNVEQMISEIENKAGMRINPGSAIKNGGKTTLELGGNLGDIKVELDPTNMGQSQQNLNAELSIKYPQGVLAAERTPLQNSLSDALSKSGFSDHQRMATEAVDSANGNQPTTE